MNVSLVFIIFLIALIELFADYHLQQCSDMWSFYFLVIIAVYLTTATVSVMCKKLSDVREVTLIQTGIGLIIGIVGTIVFFDKKIDIHEIIAVGFILLGLGILWKY